jgi:type IV pilus assembly protein PilO
MLTTRTARWSAVTGLVCVIVLVATWFVLVGPRRSEAADLADQEAAAESQNISLRAQIRALEEQYADLPAKRDQLRAIRSQMPPAADVADLVRKVDDYADQSGASLTSITPGTATKLSPATPTTPAVVSIPVTIEASGRYVESTLFVKYLQSMNRRFLVTGLVVTRGAAAEQTSTTASTTAATTASPTATTSPTTTATPTATATTTATTTTTPTDMWTLKITGEIFSLVDAPEASAAPSAGATPAPSVTTAP